jgi:hypothetical protein
MIIAARLQVKGDPIFKKDQPDACYRVFPDL